MGDDLHVLLERIRALLAEPPSDSRLDELELTLTDGYAEALVLEAERTRVERAIAELAGGIEDPIRIGELRELSAQKAQADSELTSLRALLELLRERLAEQRAAVSP